MSTAKRNPTKQAQIARIGQSHTNNPQLNKQDELEAAPEQDFAASAENMVAPGGRLRSDWAKQSNILSLQRVIGNQAVMRRLQDQKSGAVVQRMTGAASLTGAAGKKGLNSTNTLRLNNLITKIQDSGTGTDQQERALRLYGELQDKYEQEKMQALILLLQEIPDEDFETEGGGGGLNETAAAEAADRHGWWVVENPVMRTSQTYKTGKKHAPKGRLYTDGEYFYSGDNTGHAGTDWKIYGGTLKSLDWRGGVSDDAPRVLIQRGAQRGRDITGAKI